VLPTPYGEFRVIAFENQVDQREHVALVKGDIEGGATCWCACTPSA
jgi:3,4-dihydroxy 2-butanone 4-phosphate synthase / GTP cyclohydrolase II